MKNYSKKILLLGIAIQLTSQAFSQPALLDINQIRTNVQPLNSLFWDQTQFADYEVPKGSGKHSLFLGSLWFIGKNSTTQSLHGFADRYRANGPDTWSGPLKIDGSAATNMSTVLDFGRVWKLNRVDIDALIQAQGNGTLTSGAYVPPVDILQWPGNGPAGYAQQLSPYHDHNSDGIYNIYDGDYPMMKGEQMLYWILNDNFGTHNETSLLPMGIEIHISFYACKNDDATGSDDIINYTTFLEYEIINRSTTIYEDVFAGFNTDADVGYAFDDYTGSHVDADAFYFYTGDSIDAQGSNPAPNQYGFNSPVQSLQFLEGLQNSNGRIMSSYMYYNSGSGVTGEPEMGNGMHYYYLMQSKFKDGTPLHYGGYGYPNSFGVTDTLASYMFPGGSDPSHQGTGGIDPGFAWSQQFPCPSCPQSPAADVRGVGATGPFVLQPNASVKIVMGLITTFDSTLTIDARVEKNREQNKQLKQWYDANALPCVYSQLSNDDLDAPMILTVHPNPASSVLYITNEKIEQNTSYTVSDINGRSMISGIGQQQGQIILDVESLPAGIYFVKLSNKNGRSHTVKFIKH